MSGTIERRSTEQKHGQTTNDALYIGSRRQGRPGVRRVATDDELSPDRSLEVRNHSPTGFEWGYGGSGPAQLAPAILLDYTGDENIALEHYMRFKDEVVSRLECTAPDGCWHLSADVIETVLRDEAELEVTARV